MESPRCAHCDKELEPVLSRRKGSFYKFCSRSCYHSSTKGVRLTGRKLEKSRLSIKKATELRRKDPGVRSRWIAKMSEVQKGEKNSSWVKDRSKLVNQADRNSYQYLEWAESVRERDGRKCRIGNSNCHYILEVHHILSWREYPELRFNINNGITLCRAHHPRKRAEEKRLIPVFQELVSIS